MTLAILGAVAAFLIVYDFWTDIKKGSETTISWQLYLAGKTNQALPFAVGFICGHIFFVQHGA